MNGFSTCIYDLKGQAHFLKSSDRIYTAVAYLIASTGNEEGLIKCIKYPIDIHGDVLYRIFPKGIKDEYIVARTNIPFSDQDYYKFYNSFSNPYQMYRYMCGCLKKFKDHGVQMDFLNYCKKLNLTVNINFSPENYSLTVSEYEDDNEEETRIYAEYTSETFDHKMIVKRIVDRITSYFLPVTTQV